MIRDEVLGPTFTTPSGPDVLPIIELHRGNDGWVAFQRRNSAGQFERVLSVKASDLAEVFPEFIAPHVDEESYFGINSMHLTARQQQWRSTIEPKFPHAQWGTSMLRHLTAAYVDLDCYKMGITVGQCIGEVIDAQDRGEIPPASIITRSGRGVWLFWLLQGDEGPGPVRAWPESVSTYRRIERDLLLKCGRYGADAQATDPARITRIPGSMHRAAGVRVAYWVQHDQHQRPITYRLNELATLLGVRPAKYPASVAKIVDPKLSERGRKGYAALHTQRLAKLMRLIAERGGAHEGCRNRTAWLMVAFMRGCKVDRAEITRLVLLFGKHQCFPPLKDHEINSVLQSRTGTKGHGFKYSNHIIADWLKITPAESAMVGWPAAGTRPIDDHRELRTRADRTTSRREHLQGFVENYAKHNGGEIPTLATCMEFIERQTGARPSTKTMRADLIALGIVNPRARRKRITDGPMLLGT